jgi:hypothetical protein
MKYEGIKEIQSIAYDSQTIVRKRIKKKSSRILTLVMFQIGIVLIFFACLLLVNLVGIDNKVFDAVKAGFGLF